MNKNSLLTKAIAGFLAVLMVFGTLVSLRGFSVAKAEIVNGEPAQSEPTKAGNGVGHRVITQQVKFGEITSKQRPGNQGLEAGVAGAYGDTYIALWYEGVESKDEMPKNEEGMATTTRVWLAQDQYKNPGAFQGEEGGKILKYCDPRGESFYVTDENNYRGFIYNENYGPNKNWWLKTNTYYNSANSPWSLIEKIIYIGTESSDENSPYQKFIKYFKDTIYRKMMDEYSAVGANGCAIMVDVYDPVRGGTTEYIGANITPVNTGYGFYRDVVWHRDLDKPDNGGKYGYEPTPRDMQLFEWYLLPAMIQCAIYAVTNGNTNVEVPGAGKWEASHEMHHNQREYTGKTVARREVTRDMYNGSTSGSGKSSGSYVRMLVDEILRMARDDVKTVPAANKISYSMPVHEIGRNKTQESTHTYPTTNEYGVFITVEEDNDPKYQGPNGEWYGYMGVFKVGAPAEEPEEPIKVTFHAEFYTDIAADGSLTGKTNTPHTNAGIQWPRDFTFDVGLTNGGSQVATGHTPVMNGDVVANPTSTGNTWDYTWNNMPKVSKADDYGINISNLNEEWVFLPGKTSHDMDSNGNVTVTGRFLYNRTRVSIEKKWNGSSTIPTGAFATFQLKKNGNPILEPKTLSATSDWNCTWDKLEKYVPNTAGSNLGGIKWENATTPKTYVYSVEETNVSAGWKKDTNPVVVNGAIVFNNTIDNECIDITVNKVWKDMNGNPVSAPAGVTVKADLYQNGAKMGRPTKDLNEGTNWTGTWVKLPKYDANGNLYQYTVKESNVPNGWASTVTNSGLNYTITNTKTNEKYDITITKNWVGGTPDAGTNVKVDLYQNGVKMGRPTKDLNEGNGWTGTWVELPKYDANGNLYQYSVKELNVPAGWTSIAPAAQSFDNSNLSLTLTNTRNKITVTFVQEWYTGVDENGNLTGKTTEQGMNFNSDEGLYPWRPACVQLYKDGQAVGSILTASYDTTINGTRWAASLNNLDAGTYTAQYAPASGYENRYHPEQYGWLELPSYTEITVDNEGNVTITFKALADFVNRTVVKTWADENKSGGLTYTATSATVELRKNGTAVESVELNAGNNWTKTWTKLPKFYVNDNGVAAEVDYEIAETAFAVNGETVTDGFSTEYALNGSTTTITNTRDQVQINITLINKWVGMDNQIEWDNVSDKYIPREIGYQLYANGQAVGEPQFFTNPYGYSKDWDDQAVWNNLPKYDENGKEIVYSVRVANPDDRWWLDDRTEYTKASTKTEGVYVDENGNYRFDLMHRWDLTNIKVEKSWTKNGIPTDAPADAEITVKLMKYSEDGVHELMATVTLNAENNWKAQFMTDAFTNTGEMDPFFPRYTYTENGVEKLSYFLVEEGHDENVWTPVYPENYLGYVNEEGEFVSYYSSVYNGTYTWPITNMTGDYSLDKTAKLTADGTYTATLIAQYNGSTPKNDPDTFVSDTLGFDFHVDPGYSASNVKPYIERYNADGTYTRLTLNTEGITDEERAMINALTVAVETYDRGETVYTGTLAGPNDKTGLKVNVTGFDLEKNGCYVDGEGKAHGYRLVVDIQKLLANGDAFGNDLPIGDRITPLGEEERGVCGIYKTGEESAPMVGKLRTNDTVTKQKLVFPKPTVQIREIQQVYDFGLRQRNDELLDFFGHGEEYSLGMGDISHVLALDFMYRDQTAAGYHYTYPYVGAYGYNGITYDKASIKTEQFEVGLVTCYTGEGTPTDTRWTPILDEEGNVEKYVWTDPNGHPEDDMHACFGYFEPKKISVREFTLAALIEVKEDSYVWCKLSFVPATNVYYEAEDFLEFSEVTTSTPELGKWSTAGNDIYDVDDRYQHHSTGDLQHVYGYDDAYDNGHTGTQIDGHTPYDAYGYSNGTAMQVTLNKEYYDKVVDKEKSWPTAEFTFTGEAFELFSKTTATSGFFAVQVYDMEGELRQTNLVDTRYFGAHGTAGGDDMVDQNEATGELYQIPVMRVQMAAKATYKVRISACYLPFFVPLQPTKGGITIPGLEGVFNLEYAAESDPEFIPSATKAEYSYPDMTMTLDAVRVYHPATNEHHARYLKTEKQGLYQQISEILTETDIPATGTNGGIFIDFLHIQGSGDPVLVENAQGGYTLAQYEKFGPNYEMYLRNGNAFSFVLENINFRESLHIAAKVPFKTNDNSEVKLEVTVIGLDKDGKQGYERTADPIVIKSSTEMYYSLNDALVFDNGLIAPFTDPQTGVTYQPLTYKKNLVIIKCVSDDPTAILSLTNVKLVDKSGARPALTEAQLTMDPASYQIAMASVCGIMGDVNGDQTIDMIDAIATMRHAIGGSQLNNYGLYCGDLDENASVDMLDTLSIMRAALID